MATFLGAAKAVTKPFKLKTLPQAKTDIFWKQWLIAIKDKHKFLFNNIMWTPVNPPLNRQVLQKKWVYKFKKGPDSKILQYKAR